MSGADQDARVHGGAQQTPPEGAGTAAFLAAGDWTMQVTSVAIVYLDVDGIVRGWNTGARILKGYAPEEIIGTSFERFFRAEDRERGLPKRLLADAARNGSTEDTSWRVRADGSQFWARAVVTALHDDEGRPAGFVKIVTDLTEDKRREDAAVVLMRAFTHDFMSPITALRGYVDLMEESANGTGGAPLGRLSNIADHLFTMISEMSTRLKTRHAERHTEPIDIATVIEEASGLVMPGDDGRRLRVDDLPHLTVVGNAVELRRALANVLDNAAKYSDDDIVVSLRQIGDDAAVVVSDHGRGIDPGDIPTIFEPLVRGRLAHADDGGSGIGLASARALIEQQDGRIEVESTPGVGSVFTISLPLTRRASPTPASAHDTTSQPTEKKTTAHRRGHAPAPDRHSSDGAPEMDHLRSAA